MGAPADENSALKNSGSVTALSGSTSAQLTKKFGDTARANHGSSVAVGDVNGDGFSDIVAGSWRDNLLQPSFIKNAGSVSVHSGDGYSILGMFYGSAGNDYFGTAVSVGDINSDGKADIIIGIPGLNASTENVNTGAVRVLSGADL